MAGIKKFRNSGAQMTPGYVDARVLAATTIGIIASAIQTGTLEFYL